MEAADWIGPDWIGLGQLVVGTLGIIGVVITLRISAATLRLSVETLSLNVDARNQKTDADNRAHWGERYVRAEELRQHRNKKLQQFGWQHLNFLTDRATSEGGDHDRL